MIVSGEANFNMPGTGLTVAGFTQPTVARTLLEMPPAIEKGLVQRFLWIAIICSIFIIRIRK